VNNIYPKSYLLKSLRDSNLPCTYQTILRWEKSGLIKRPKGEFKYPDRSWRFYTQEEIKEIIDIIKKIK
jgi:DNA-binding transcriptional MerR regulator